MQQIQLPPVKKGQVYLYGRVNKHGDVEHTVLVAVNDDCLPHAQQCEWAKSVGGVLYNRIDALVIYNEQRDLVRPEAYWTSEVVDWDPAYAWCQGYYYGSQYGYLKSAALRGVAVSRFTA